MLVCLLPSSTAYWIRTSGKLTYSNAGHPPPYIFHPNEIALSGAGMPLGVSDEAAWQQGSQEIPPGAILLLYTDGVLETQNHLGEFLGEEGMLSIIRNQLGGSAQSVQDALLAGIYNFTWCRTTGG